MEPKEGTAIDVVRVCVCEKVRCEFTARDSAGEMFARQIKDRGIMQERGNAAAGAQAANFYRD